MEPHESHHHHQQQQQQQQQRLSSPYFHHHLQHHHPSTVSSGNAVPSSNNGLFPPQPPQQQHQPQPQPNDGSSPHAVYPHSVPSSAVTAPAEPLKRKRGRPRKYVTPEQALEAKKMASAASSSSAKERREQAAAAGGATASSNSKKSQLGSVGKTGQSFTPHIVNIAPGEDVSQKIVMFAQQSKHELCVLSASGTISTASLRQAGGNISYEGQYEIISLSGSFIRAEQGGKTGGLSVSLSRSDGQIIGGAVGTHLIASGPVQVILGTFQLDRKKDGVKGEASNSGSRLTSPSSTGPGPGPGPGPLLGMGFRSVMESPGRNPMRGNDEQHHHQHQQAGMGGSHHFMMQSPQGMHMTHSRPAEWGGRGGNSGHDGRGGGYDLSGRLGHESSENGDYEQQMPD